MIPLHAEEVSVAKRRVVTGQVKVGTVTRESDQLVEELLEQEHVEVERTPIGKQVDKMPPVQSNHTRSGWSSLSKKRSSRVSDLSPLCQGRGQTK